MTEIFKGIDGYEGLYMVPDIGKFIAKYNGVREACGINGFNTDSGISQCCNGNLNSHQGCHWKYAD